MGNNYSCCEVEFASEEELVQHQVKDHEKKQELAGQCCSVSFDTKAGLQEHLRLHHGIELQEGGE